MVFTFNIGVPKVVKVETHSLKICDGVSWLRGVQQRFWIFSHEWPFLSILRTTIDNYTFSVRFWVWVRMCTIIGVASTPSYSFSLFSAVPVLVKILLYKKSLQNSSLETQSVITSAESPVGLWWASIGLDILL